MQVASPAPAVRAEPVPLGHPAYRPDIDGLRAIAVLAVVAFHAFPAKAQGGFVGVDVFFIISGYLISTILVGNLQRGRFRFVEFYVRRVRRIFPALLVVLVATFGFGWWSLMASEYQELGKHVAAGAGFVSNLVLWSESGYFDATADAKPLLHLWSLGIEEQFYIFWPLLLWACWRLRVNLLAMIAVTALASFACNLYLSQASPVADFYSPWSRFWELALGAALAYATLFEPHLLARASPRQRDVQSILGGALIAVAALTLKPTSAFPGWLALLPTLGAVMIIAAGSQAWLNRTLLSHRLMVWFGLISFPLYLWHWPILSYIHILDAERPGRAVRLAAIAAAILLAWLTYRFVERPVRDGTAGRRIAPALFVGMLALGAFGFAAFRDGGFGFRGVANVAVVNEGDIGHDAFYDYTKAHFAPCDVRVLRDTAETWNDAVRCFQSRPGPVDVALVGDSHAEHLFIGLAEALPERNVAAYVHSALPIVGNPQFVDIFRTVLGDPRIRTVVLSAWWSLRFAELPPGTSAADALAATTRALTDAGKTVFIADDTPNFSFSPQLCKYQSSVFRKHKCAEDASFFGQQREGHAALFAKLERDNPRVHVLSPAGYFCDESRCAMAGGGKLWFRDSDHLGVEGSQYVVRRLVADYPALREAR